MKMFQTLLPLIGALFTSLPITAQITASNHSIVIDGNKGTISIFQQSGITLQEHQKAIELEKRLTEERLRALYQRRQKSDRAEIELLKENIDLLTKRSDSLNSEKIKLSQLLDEYDKRYGWLLSNKISGESIGSSSQAEKDVVAIETSKDSKDALLAEILSRRDNDRLMAIVQILMAETGSMDDAERQNWKDTIPAASFDQRYRLLSILAGERATLAQLARKYGTEIKHSQDKNIREWAELVTKFLFTRPTQQ